MYQPTLGQFLSRDPLGPDGVDVLYDNNWFGDRLATMRTTYGYVNGNPVTAVDPSGLRPFDFGERRNCAGTDCGEDGIATLPNPNADPSCDHICKSFIVEAHEAVHRRNMKACCDRAIRCKRYAIESPDVPENARQRYLALCTRAWEAWRDVNRDSLELRAAVESCNAARWLITQASNGMLDMPSDCCAVANRQLYLCKGNNANARIEACPFERSGEIVPDSLYRLLDLLEEAGAQERRPSP